MRELCCVVSIGLLFLIFSGPVCWAEETTASPPTPPTEQAPAQAEEKPKTETVSSPEQPAPIPETPPTGVPTPPAEPSTPSKEEPQKEAAPQVPPTPAPEPPSGAAPVPQPAPAQQPAAPQEEEKPEVHKEAEKAIAPPEEAKQPVKVVEVERGGLLLEKGKLEIDLDFAYSHFSNNQLFINGFSILPILVVGQVNVERVRRDFFVASLTGKYGLMEDVQLEVRIPYQVTFNRVSTAQGIGGTGTALPNIETTSETADLGDIETTLYYQFWKERTTRPALFLGLAWKSKSGRDSFQTPDPANEPPSGTGFTSLKGIVSAIKTADPAVLFGSISYAYAFPRRDVVLHSVNQPPKLIDFDPGDNFTFGMGLAYAINYRLTLNFQFLDSITFSSEITEPDLLTGVKEQRTVTNSFINAAFFRMGASWSVTPTNYIELSLTQGLTSDAPDFTLGIKIPFKF